MGSKDARRIAAVWKKQQDERMKTQMADTNGNGGITVVTEENFDAEVKNSDKLVVLDFWAEWCGSCRMIAPIMEELSQEMADVKFCKVNVDEQLSIAMKYRVVSIPMLAFFKNGEMVGSSVGYEPKEAVRAKIEGAK